MSLKLEQEEAGIRLKVRLTLWCEHYLIEELGIQETWVCLTCPGSISCLFRKGRNREFLPHLETHLKVFGNLA